MKRTAIVFCLLFTLFSYSQIHWLVNKDETTDCNLIQSGKFVVEITESEIVQGYYLIFKDGFCTEYVENGKYYLRSKVEFDTPCSYTDTVLESTIPDYDAGIGGKVYTEILESATTDNLIKVRSKEEGGEWKTFILKKVE